MRACAAVSVAADGNGLAMAGANREQALFERDALHPSAAEAIDAAGLCLLEVAETRPPMRPRGQSFQSRRVPSETLTEADLIGEPLLAWTDWAGNIVGRYFVDDGRETALREQGYLDLRKVVERVLRSKPFSQGVSAILVEEEIFKWWRGRLRDGSETALSAHLLDAIAGEFRSHRLLVPLSAIEIERPFYLGNVLVTPIDPGLFERWGLRGEKRNPDSAESIRRAIDRMRREIGHLTAVEVQVLGDLSFARAHARSVAFDIAAVLRFMSPAAVSWNVAFGCFPHGCEHIPRTTVIEVEDGEITTSSTGILHLGLLNWQVSSAELDHLMNAGYRNLAAFFDGKPLTGFAQRVKTAIIAYSQSIASHDVSSRLIYAMSAAEHLLLRDASEPIQTGVGERMAFLIAKDSGERREVLSNFKKAYSLRSRQVHHLTTIVDETVLSAFFCNMFMTLFRAVEGLPLFKEHHDFLDGIDAIKFR